MARTAIDTDLCEKYSSVQLAALNRYLWRRRRQCGKKSFVGKFYNDHDDGGGVG